MNGDHADEAATPGNSTPAPETEKPVAAIDPALYAREDMRRILATLDIAGLYRALKNDPGLSQRQIAARMGATATFGAPIKGFGEPLAQLGDPTPEPLPSQVNNAHIVKVRNLIQRLLHTIAGSGAYDATRYDHTLYYYGRALELTIEAGDAYLQALALTYAGLATDEHGYPDDGLKMLQLAQVKAWELPRDHDRRHAVEATALAHSATAYARLGDPKAADRELAKSRQRGRTLGCHLAARMPARGRCSAS